MAGLRIFSYLPNPRIWKATIAARLCGVTVEVRGAAPEELAGWLWDFDARPLSPQEKTEFQHLGRTGRLGLTSRLYKTDAFLKAHPFGTVPAAFSADGRIGIFESNSIMRCIARLGEVRMPLYGRDPYEASRIDSFLDVSLVFARDAQLYILALRAGSVSPEVHARAAQAFAAYLGGIECALAGNAAFLVGERLTLADICFVAELALFHNELLHRDLLARSGLQSILSGTLESDFPRALAHFSTLCAHPAFVPDAGPYLRGFPPR